MHFNVFQVLKGMALSVLVLWTIAANSLVFIVLYKNPRLQTVPNLLVGNLAFSDLCLGIIVLPLSSVYAIAGRWLFPETLCVIFVSADILCSTASIWNLSIVGLDRYWAITSPVAYMTKRNKKTAVIMILSVWVSSALISLAPLLGWKQVADHGNLVQINGSWQCTFLDLPSYTIYSATGSFFIPIIVMFFVYFKIYQAFAKHRARQIYRQKVIRKHIESTILHEISHVLPTSDEFAKDEEDGDEDEDCSDSSEKDYWEEDYDKDEEEEDYDEEECDAVGNGNRFRYRNGTSGRGIKFTTTTTSTVSSNYTAIAMDDAEEEEEEEREKERRDHQRVNGTCGIAAPAPPLNDSSGGGSSATDESGGGGGENRRRRRSSGGGTDRRKRSRRSGSAGGGKQSSDYRCGVADDCSPSSPNEETAMNAAAEGGEGESRKRSGAKRRQKSRANSTPKERMSSCRSPSYYPPDVDSDLSTRETSLCSNSVIVRRQTPPALDGLVNGTAAAVAQSPSLVATAASIAIATSADATTAAGAGARTFRFPVSRIASVPTASVNASGGVRKMVNSCEHYAHRHYHNAYTYKCLLKKRGDGGDVTYMDECRAAAGAASPPLLADAALRKKQHSKSARDICHISYEKVKRYKQRKERIYRKSLQKKPKAISAAKERRGVKVLGIILGCFTICWTPFFVMYVVVQFCSRCLMNQHIEMFITWLGYSNSAMNPIIYTVFNRDYQIALKRLFTSANSGSNHTTNQTTNNNNNNNSQKQMMSHSNHPQAQPRHQPPMPLQLPK